MKDLHLLIFCAILCGGVLICLHRIALLTHRVDMLLIVQQSQQDKLDALSASPK